MGQHHVEVRVSRQTFRNNVQSLRTLVAPSKLCVVMKANAYGHGLEALAPVAVEAGADYLGICTNPEAETVRRLALPVKLLRLRMALRPELDQSVAELDMEEQIGTMQAAEHLAKAGRRRGRDVLVHLKIDTGMGRGGFFPEDLKTVREAVKLQGLRVRGVMTHFATADAASLAQTEGQLEKMRAVREALAPELDPDVLWHTHNSAATVRLPQSRQSLVRVGAACYGVRTSREFDNPPALKPVMSFRTWVAQVRDIPRGHPIGYGSLFTTTRDSKVAALPVGFGEGYPRALFNKGIVLIHGRRCPVVGRVSLNVVTVDVTDCPDEIKWGDEAVLIGRQGDEEVTFEEMADQFSSVHTEINLMAGFMNRITYS
jgi:alanine racemase